MADTNGAANASGNETMATAQTRRPRPQPKVIGPIQGGVHGWPFGCYFGEIGKVGYAESEYFIDGVAQRYRPTGPNGFDGVWSVEPATTSPYRTRILVQRPMDDALFNGTVIVEWINVTSGFDAIVHDLPVVFQEGFAYVGVSVQSVGVNGVGAHPMGLKTWDPERYESLNHPGDSCSYDIFSQAGLVVGPNRAKDEIDPLGGLDVKSVIAFGASQSAARMTTYINAIQPVDQIFDAFLLAVSFGLGGGFEDRVIDRAEIATLSFEDGLKLMGNPTQIREDIAVPVMVVNSETESLSFGPTRRPDTDRFRFWEVAGASHVPLPMMAPLGEKSQRDFAEIRASLGASQGQTPPSISHVSWTPVVNAATSHVNRWIREGTPPPKQEFIEHQGAPARIVRDADGNALGGARLPEMAVPIARNDGVENGLFGHNSSFSPEQLKALYPTHQRYVEKVAAAASAAVQSGIILPDTAKEYVKAASATTLS